MGKCVKCGRETKNEYGCYSADSKSNITEYYDAENYSERYEYSNFEYHEDYACGKCIVSIGKTILTTIVAVVFSFMAIFFLGIIFYSLIEEGFHYGMILIFIFFILPGLWLGIPSSISSVKFIRARTKDGRCENRRFFGYWQDGVEIVMQYYKTNLYRGTKRKNNVKFFRLKEYERLLKENGHLYH